jgi:CheY-like chemotaxis protein
MAKILVVDDNAVNRKLIAALLNFEGHQVIEAVDGGEGLAAARAERPQLVISDILMPSMDGYEFVRQLRADPQLGRTAVIFHTAHYHERAAQKLAAECQVARVIIKAGDTRDLLDAVKHVLAGNSTPQTRPITDGFDREHLRLLTDKLAEKAADLQASNARFAALAELNVQFASERDPRLLLEKVCAGARHLIGTKYAVLAVSDGGRGDALIFCVNGVDFGEQPAERPRVDSGLLASVAAERRARRVSNADDTPIDIGLPASYPPARAFLVAPLISLTQTFGWLCLADKLAADTFSAEDEHVLSFLGAQVGRIYENGSLYREVQQYAAQLLVEIDERKRSAARIEHLNRVHALLSGINSLIVRIGRRDELFVEVCRLATEQGRFRSAWCGWVDAASAQLVSIASSGDSIDLIAQISTGTLPGGRSLVCAAMRLQQPGLCNDLQRDPCDVPFRREMFEHGYGSIVALRRSRQSSSDCSAAIRCRDTSSAGHYPSKK